jgi:hypothetical protein
VQRTHAWLRTGTPCLRPRPPVRARPLCLGSHWSHSHFPRGPPPQVAEGKAVSMLRASQRKAATAKGSTPTKAIVVDKARAPAPRARPRAPRRVTPAQWCAGRRRAGAGPRAPPPSPCTNWTRLVLPPVLSGHAASFPPCRSSRPKDCPRLRMTPTASTPTSWCRPQQPARRTRAARARGGGSWKPATQ